MYDGIGKALIDANTDDGELLIRHPNLYPLKLIVYFIVS